jgi:telomerase protein component 1
MIDSNKIPYMAMVRNLRNMIEVGISPDHHARIANIIEDPARVISSRMFPFRFFSAYQMLSKLNKELEIFRYRFENKSDYTYKRKVRGRKARTVSRAPMHCPTPDIIMRYKDALENAIKISTAENVLPIKGISIIFCDVSGSMKAPVSGGAGFGSVNTCAHVGMLMGLMLNFVCESSEYKIFASPKPENGPLCYRDVEIQSDSILENM